MKFSDSIFFEIRNYKGFVFNPMRVFNVLYDEQSEDRTPILEEIMQREVFIPFANKLQAFGSRKTFESFADMYFIKSSNHEDLQELSELFAAVVDDFIASYEEDDAYYSYCYAVLLVSIIVSTAGYFPEALLYKFVHFCRKNAILKI